MSAGSWLKNSRYGEIFRVSLPLVMSVSATTVMEFTDRLFLSNHSLDAIAAVCPAGIAAFFCLVFFAGVAGYLNVFIAQYTGAGISGKVGACLWQGIWFSVFSAIALAGISFLAGPIFRLGGHAPEIQILEAAYFRILLLGGGLNVLGACLGCFFSGRGITRPVMLVNAGGMVFNIPLDYAMINGVWIFPEMGIRGAAGATVASWGVIAIALAAMIFTRENNRKFGVLSAIALDGDLFRRLLKYGIPGSLQFCSDIFAFTFFVFIVGRIGKEALAVTNIVLSINSLAFMPAMGFSQGVNILTGQAIGGNRPNEAVRCLNATLHILLAYSLLLDMVFLFAPETVLDLFLSDSQKAETPDIMQKGIALLRVVAFYVIFDAMYMVYTGLLKGAGDTRFIMWSVGLVSLMTMIIPVYIGVEYIGAGLYFTWGCATMFIVTLFLTSFARYRQGKWKTMRVIREAVYTD